MNVAAFVLEHAADEAPALVESQRVVSYRQLRGEAGRIRQALSSAGAAGGQRVLLVAENSSFWVAGYLGILAAGLVCVPLPPKIEAAQLQSIIASASPAFAVVQARLAGRLRESLPPGLRLLTDLPLQEGESIAVSAMPERALEAVEVDDRRELAGLFFTSGSTGTPHGVMVTHRNIIANTNSILGYLPLEAGDRMLQILPMHYCFGTSLLHTHLRAGASIVIENGFLFPDRVLDSMLARGCTGFAGVPANYQILLRKSRFARLRLPSLRYMLQAGGKLADEFIEEVRSAQPQARLYVMYGQTEATARLSYLPPDMLDCKRGSIGRGIPGVTLEVIGEDGQRVKPGETGQIVASGENISPGYWQAPEESAEVFREGRLYTGDIARVDEDGFLYVVGRSRDFLKLGGTRVSCQQLERALLRFPGMVDAAAVSVPDAYLGEAAVYFVVHREGEAMQEAFLSFCKTELPPAHWPKQVVVLPDLPRTASGKTDRPRLRQLAAGAPA